MGLGAMYHAYFTVYDTVGNYILTRLPRMFLKTTYPRLAYVSLDRALRYMT